jgi:hypothetical protein
MVRYSFSGEDFPQEGRLRFGSEFDKSTAPRGAPIATILFIPLSAEQGKLESDWAVVSSQIILRRCPCCERDSIVGHAAAANGLTTKTTTGFRFDAAGAGLATRPSLSCRSSRHPTAITA